MYIAQELSFPHGFVGLQCDGYQLTLAVVCVGTLKYKIGFYVNGVFKGKWLLEDCEERRRFFCRREVFLHRPKLRAELIKIYGGKRAAKSKVAEVNQKFTSYRSHWDSVASLRRHLEKNNKDIHLVKVGYLK